MSKVLGIDLGTNSIGWAIVERDGTSTSLVDKGVHIFQEGVNRVKGNEEPTVKTRTEARASRRHYFRRRLRKIELLKILVEQKWCPYLSSDALKAWKETKRFPLDPDFLKWLRTDDFTNINPYHDRHRCLNEKLDLTKREDRYTLGRALYHLNQRRGFLSNRKDQGSEDATGKVAKDILDLNAEMQSSGFIYIGDYFYHLYNLCEPIRHKYTDRKEHYIKEFNAICEKQDIDLDLVQKLFSAIFFQRPLKSQKGLVGKCPFEKGKPRSPISHPDFEEFRMRSFINNIRVALPGETEMRPLSSAEISAIEPLFFRKSKDTFDFADISKKLAGKGIVPVYKHQDDAARIDTFRINYRDTTTVSGCPVTSQFKALFSEDWKSAICEQYTLSDGKSQEQIIDDIWHALQFFDDDDKLQKWAADRLQLSEKDSKLFASIKVPQGYASLSHCAISKMLPWLREGMRYDEAAMMANIPAVVGKKAWTTNKEEIIRTVVGIVTSYVPNHDIANDSKERKIEEELCNLGIYDLDMTKFYHPSMIETYPQSRPDANGLVLLQSPRTDSIRNPMAMRSLFRLRALINGLIKEGKIDKFTKINIELSRNLNDFNSRRAIDFLQRDNEKRRESYRKSIDMYYAEQGIEAEPTDEDILKYELWEEQKHICLYTGIQIPLSGFLGANPRFDIEHTVPRSRGGDNSKANKTLCESHFNRDIKKSFLPSELANGDEILNRVAACGWEEAMESLRKDIAKATKSAKSASDKASKDKAIQRRHIAKMQLDYYSDKIRRFKMRDVPEGFTNRQGVDIGIIGRYARLYIQSVFEKVYSVKGETTAEFRKMWGLQDSYAKKERVNHTHHCIDAITIACIGKQEYDMWAQYKRDEENFILYGAKKPSFPKPWETFTEDVKGISDNLLVSHYTADNMSKQTKRIMKKSGAIQRGDDGNPKYVRGDSARGSLHLQTYYGAIKKDEEVKYVIRKELALLADKDLKNIVDDVVREKVLKAVENGGLSALQGTIWMNEEKCIPIKKVRLFAPNVTNPLTLKEQRFKSDADYKRNYYVVNESNYAMLIFEGLTEKGKQKRSFKMINNLEAARLFNQKTLDVLPREDENGFSLKYVLQNGTVVLFYEPSEKNLKLLSQKELSKRLYKTLKFSTNSIVCFIHNQEARPVGNIEYRKGPWLSSDEFRPIMAMSYNQVCALVQNVDFKITVTGRIVFL